MTTLYKVDIISTYRTLPPKMTEYAFFSKAHETFSRIEHILGHRTSLNKFKKIEIIPSIFSYHSGTKLEITTKRKLVKL